MDGLITYALVGMGIGSLYVLAAQGLIVIFRGSGVLNLGLGAIGMVGAYMAWDLANGIFLVWDVPVMPFWVALIVGMLISAGVGALVQQFIIRPLGARSALVKVIATLGVLLTLQALVILRWTSVAKVPTSPFPNDLVDVLGARVNMDKFIMVGIAIVVTAGLYVFYRYTRFGLSTTAVAENETVAASLGLSPNRVALINWAIGSGLAGVFAILIAPTVTLQPVVMTNLVLAATSVALVAGFRSFPIALGAGLVIGVAQTVVQGQISGIPGIGTAVPFLFIVLWLTFRGQGIPSRDFVLQRLPSVGTGRLRWPLIFSALVVVLAMAFSVSNVWLDGFIITMAAGIMMLSVVVLTGYAGQLSLAQFAIGIFGAWVAGRVAATQGWPFLVVLVIGVAATVPLGLLFAIPAVRTRGINLAIVTLGLGTVLYVSVFNNQNLTGGTEGTVIAEPTIFGWNIWSAANPLNYMLVVLVFLMLMVIMVSNLRRGRSGRRLLAVRANERAAAALGINVRSAKLYAFGVAAGIASVGGVLYAFRNTSIRFGNYDNFGSIALIADTMIGGIGYLGGAVMGGTLFGGGFNSRILNSLGDGIEAYIPLISGARPDSHGAPEPGRHRQGDDEQRRARQEVPARGRPGGQATGDPGGRPVPDRRGAAVRPSGRMVGRVPPRGRTDHPRGRSGHEAGGPPRHQRATDLRAHRAVGPRRPAVVDRLHRRLRDDGDRHADPARARSVRAVGRRPRVPLRARHRRRDRLPPGPGPEPAGPDPPRDRPVGSGVGSRCAGTGSAWSRRALPSSFRRPPPGCCSSPGSPSRCRPC